ncbi:MJ1255/VC2487 family glycosyltransferase [Shewanella intestini]|uniref:Glycosyltransferase n=1 Tax=Shewanella intestini TaxID=2017544 RepID=A0ABS5I0J0_9GAMM|nr:MULTISPECIES: MJ1255/VC2487 family glycosyltransferase [Shewanella]MBR9727541.1 glycosyltransferase [Shewanella intestini]MRG35309.1 glycosyltransferase [Shewanella sp. XMDDZSB0408]
MNLLYGVQGTGNGHISRARVMAKAFEQQNVKVDYLFSGRDDDEYFDMACFGDYQTRSGMTFVSEKGRVKYLKTGKQNLQAPMRKEVNELDLSKYDLVLNDFEPVSAWAAKRQGVTSISVSHQAAFKYGVPKRGMNWFNELLINHFAPADVSLGCHWHHFGYPILPPFVDVTQDVQGENQRILVYLPFEAADDIVTFLSATQAVNFVVYHKHIPSMPLPPHIQWCGFDRQRFKTHLARCGGVIGNAGFELASEAMTLGKKLLVKPLVGQFEQTANVAALELLAAAQSMNKLDATILTRWLKASSPAPIAYPQVGDVLAKWVVKGDWFEHKSLCDNLWQQVSLPDNWAKKQ